jgi:AcrR family transcriptional regulator
MTIVPRKKAGRPCDQGLADRRREEILDAAAQLFAEKGYSETSTQLLADRLQVGKGTIYRYFPTKRSLFLAAVDRAMTRLRESIDQRTQNIEDPLERGDVSIAAHLRYLSEHPEIVELLIQERAQFKDRAKPTYFEYHDRSVERWRAVIGDLIAAGRVRDIPVDRIVETMSDLVYGTMFTNYFTGRRRSPEEQARDLMDVMHQGILSESERKRRQQGF